MNPNATIENSDADAARQLHMAAHNGVRSLSGSTQMLRDQARHAADVVRERAVAAQQRTSRYVAEEPMKSLLAAAAVGALITGLALFFGSRRGR